MISSASVVSDLSDEHEIPPATKEEIEDFLFFNKSLKSLISKEHVQNAVKEMKERKDYRLKQQLVAEKSKKFYEKNKEALAHNAFFSAAEIKNCPKSLVAILEWRMEKIHDEIDSGKWFGESLDYAKGCFFELGNLLTFLPGSLGHTASIKNNEQRTIGEWLGVELIEIEEE